MADGHTAPGDKALSGQHRRSRCAAHMVPVSPSNPGKKASTQSRPKMRPAITNLLQLESWHGCSAMQFAAQTKNLQLKGVLPLCDGRQTELGWAGCHCLECCSPRQMPKQAALHSRRQCLGRSTAVLWVSEQRQAPAGRQWTKGRGCTLLTPAAVWCAGQCHFIAHNSREVTSTALPSCA